MQKRTIGSSDLSVSTICLGSMTWGNQNSEADAHEQLDFALSQGINFVDTAEMYPVPIKRELQGMTETFIGSWIEKRGKRDDIILASKVASKNQSASIGTRDGTPGLTRESIRAALDGSLSRLQTDYLDLYQVHVPDRSTNNFGKRAYIHQPEEDGASIEETLETLTELVKEGKVRHVGVSNESPWGAAEYLRLSREKGLSRIVSIQNQYSLMNRTFEIGLSEFVFRENIGLLAYSPLSMAVLTGKYLRDVRPEGSRFTILGSEKHQARYNPPHAQLPIEKYVGLAKEKGIDPAQMAIAFVLSRPFVASAIIGATTMEQLKINIGAGDVTLDSDTLERIDAIYKEYPDPTV